MKKNTWNVRHLVDESFVSSAQWTSVLYCRLSDFIIYCKICFKRDWWLHFQAHLCQVLEFKALEIRYISIKVYLVDIWRRIVGIQLKNNGLVETKFLSDSKTDKESSKKGKHRVEQVTKFIVSQLFLCVSERLSQIHKTFLMELQLLGWRHFSKTEVVQNIVLNH